MTPQEYRYEVRDKLSVARLTKSPNVLQQCEDFLTDLLTAQADKIEALKQAICAHRDAKADDRCIEDDDRLYAVLGDGVKCDRRVGDKAAMLANCARFIDKRCEGGGWRSYAELEHIANTLASRVAQLEQELADSRDLAKENQ